MFWKGSLFPRHNPTHGLVNAGLCRMRKPYQHAQTVTDLHAVLRGHNESILDLMDEPEKSAEFLWRLGGMFREFTEELWKRVPLFHGGYFDA